MRALGSLLAAVLVTGCASRPATSLAPLDPQLRRHITMIRVARAEAPPEVVVLPAGRDVAGSIARGAGRGAAIGVAAVDPDEAEDPRLRSEDPETRRRAALAYGSEREARRAAEGDDHPADDGLGEVLVEVLLWPFTALAGAIAGAFAGGVYGAATAPESEGQRYIAAPLRVLVDEADVQSALRDYLVERIRSGAQVGYAGPDAPAAVLEAAAVRVEVPSPESPKDPVPLTLVTRVRVLRPEGGRVLHEGTVVCETATHPLGAWLAPDGDVLTAELTGCAARTAADAARLLFAPAPEAPVLDRGA
ncbi:MAG TPA: hypothetical protein VF406_08270 [Thermodesulfobacteriota bacterium]